MKSEPPKPPGPTTTAPPRGDGGLLSLAIAAKLLGVALDLEALRREHLPTGAPATPEDVLRIARAAGFKARAGRSSVARLDKIALPIIALRKTGGYLVLAKRVEAGLLVGVDGGPPEVWTLDKLAENWDGNVFYLARRDRETGDTLTFGLAWFWPVIVRFRRILAEVLVISVFIQLVALVAPLFSQVVIDKVIVHRGLITLQVLVIGLLMVVVADALLNWLRTYTFAHTTSRMDAILGSLLFKHLLALPIGYFETRPAGQTVARVRELENIRQFLTSSALTLAIDVIFSLIVLAVMWFYSPGLTLIVLASIPCYLIVSFAITPALKARVQEKFRKGAANQSMLVECLSGIQTLKAMAVEPQSRQRWEEQLAAYVGSSLKVVTLGAAGS
jgi:subfamily B ATP-binding cassette protein HlyB/CyaB